MANINFSDPAVIAALIQSIGAVLAAVIASVSAVLVGQRFVDQKRLQEKLQIATDDIAFLLGVEEEHVSEQGQKLAMRDRARERGLIWSGRFTPGRVRSS